MNKHTPNLIDIYHAFDRSHALRREGVILPSTAKKPTMWVFLITLITHLQLSTGIF